MRKSFAASAVVVALVVGETSAATCERPQDAVAVQAVALQQEMMVAALMCRDIARYNHFIISHQEALASADRALLHLFKQANAETGLADYNLYKTELANASSLRSVSDPEFCSRSNANMSATPGRPLEELLIELPYPVDTGSVRCPAPLLVKAASDAAEEQARRRTWLDRVWDSIFD